MRRKLLLVLTIAGLLVAVALGVWLFTDYGAAQKSSRLSTLMSVRKHLVDYAKSNGEYPQKLEDAICSQILLVEIQRIPLEYVAAGKPYPLVGDKRLFYEKKARRYAFEVGWFEFEEDDWSFCKERSKTVARGGAKAGIRGIRALIDG